MRYIVNKNPQSDGYHEVHKTDCLHRPTESNSIGLGEHISCISAISSARVYFAKVDGCYYCAKKCHTR